MQSKCVFKQNYILKRREKIIHNEPNHVYSFYFFPTLMNVVFLFDLFRSLSLK